MTSHSHNTGTRAKPLLDQVNFPEDLRKLPESDLRQFADELRQEMIEAVSETGGHLGAGLGVVELTVALHYLFDTPRDRLIWDVGHQAYPHKILTGRRDRIRTLRQGGGLSGFTRRVESEYDPFGAAHSSTSISAGLGMAVARDLKGGKNNVIAVIGDGAMSAGMAYEAMNNAGARDERLIVILNDNDMSIAPPTGALSKYLARATSSGTYLHLRDYAKQLAKMLPKKWERRAARVEEMSRTAWSGGMWFEELGFYYVGPIDGHDLNQLLPVLRNVRDAGQAPVLVPRRGQSERNRAARRERIITVLIDGFERDGCERAAEIEIALDVAGAERRGLRQPLLIFGGIIVFRVVIFEPSARLIARHQIGVIALLCEPLTNELNALRFVHAAPIGRRGPAHRIGAHAIALIECVQTLHPLLGGVPVRVNSLRHGAFADRAHPFGVSHGAPFVSCRIMRPGVGGRIEGGRRRNV